MLNYQFSQKFKLLENDEFNHLTIILTVRNEEALICYLVGKFKRDLS